MRGSPVTVVGSDFPADPSFITLRLGDVEIGAPVSVASDRKSLIFIVPDGSTKFEGPTRDAAPRTIPPAPLGQALLRFKFRSPVEYPVVTAPDFSSVFVHIVSETRPTLTLTKVAPAAVAPDSKHLWLIGEGMGGKGTDYSLVRDGRELALCWDGAHDCKGNKARFVSPYQLEIDGPFDDWEGLHQFTLRRGDVWAQGDAVSVRFIAWKPATVRFVAAGVSVVIFGALWLTAIGRKREIRVKGELRAFSTLLLDPETDTYSLAKLQLVLWSAAGLLAYSYLTLSRAIAQGYFDIADIPENLPTMLGISSGTAAISVGITSIKGPKAAGDVHPSFGDLVSSGGVIAPDRFQLAMWTLVAVATFLFTVFRVDPTALDVLPTIPAHLLELSTVSSGAYIAGKLVRKSGPVVDEIIATVGSLDLTIMGRSLHVDASVEIEDVSVTPFLDVEMQPNLRPQPVKPNLSTGFGSALKLRLGACAPEWLGKQHLHVTVINPDGQRATWPVTLDDSLQEHLKVLAPSLTSARPPRSV